MTGIPVPCDHECWKRGDGMECSMLKKRDVPARVFDIHVFLDRETCGEAALDSDIQERNMSLLL